MSILQSIALDKEIREYDRPPKVTAPDRRSFFEIPPSARPYYRKLRTSVSRFNFLLQYGYFRARFRFYEPDTYPAKDIYFLIEHHRFHDLKGSSKSDLQSLRDTMVGATSTRHRQEIMRLEGFVAFDAEAEERLREQALTFANRQVGKTEALGALVTFCIEQGIVLPPMQTLNNLISSTFQQEEDRLIAVVAKHLVPQRKLALLDLLEGGNQRATLLSESKSIDQAVKARSLSKNAQRLEDLQELYLGNLSVIEALGLTDQALTHYAKWVTKARTSQLGQFRNPNKTCLHLLAFVKFQFFQRQDHAIKSFLAVVKTAQNKALKMARERVFDEQAKHAPILSDIVSSQQRLMDFASEILRIMEDESMTPIQKNELVLLICV